MSRGGGLNEIRREENTFHSSQGSSQSARLRVNKQHDNADRKFSINNDFEF